MNAYLNLVFTSFLSATFIPVPSEVHLTQMYYSHYNIALIVIAASIGNILGSMFTFYTGFLGKLSWASKYLRIKSSDIQKLKSRIEKYGEYLAFFCWLPFVGDPLAFCLGYFRAPQIKFIIFMAIGKVVRYIIFIYLISKG